MCEGDVRIWFVAAVRRASSQQCINNLREPIRFQVNLGQELRPRLGIPFDVGSAQAGDKPLDVAKRQPEFMRGSRQDLLDGLRTHFCQW
jgi:hypothetical protein